MKATPLFKFRMSKMSNGRIRFTAFGLQGYIAIRKKKSRGYKIERSEMFTHLHLGKRTIAVETNKSSKRQLWNFSG